MIPELLLLAFGVWCFGWYVCCDGLCKDWCGCLTCETGWVTRTGLCAITALPPGPVVSILAELPAILWTNPPANTVVLAPPGPVFHD